MSVTIKVAEANFTKYVARQLPYLDDAIVYYLFGGTLSDSLKNHAGPVDGTAVGEIVVNPLSITTDLNIGIETGVSYADDFTYVGVINRAPGVIICSTEVSAAQDYFGVAPSNLTIVGRANGDIPNAVTAPYEAAAGRQNVVILTKVGTNLRLYSSNGVSLEYNEKTILANSSPVNPLRFGGLTWSGTADRPGNHSAFICYKRGLSEAECGNVYTYLKDMLGNRGVLVR